MRAMRDANMLSLRPEESAGSETEGTKNSARVSESETENMREGIWTLYSVQPIKFERENENEDTLVLRECDSSVTIRDASLFRSQTRVLFLIPPPSPAPPTFFLISLVFLARRGEADVPGQSS